LIVKTLYGKDISSFLKKNCHQIIVAIIKMLSVNKVHELVDWCLMTLSAQTGYIVTYEYEIYHVGLEDKTNTS